MDKENQSENIIEYEYQTEKIVSDNYNYPNNKNLPTSVTEIVECREQNTLPISSKIPNKKYFYISFNSDNDLQNFSDNNSPINDENKKIKIRKKDLNKILKMSKISEDEWDPYILFYFTSYKSEVVPNPNPMKTNKVDYRKLMRLIQNFYVQCGDNEEIEIPKKSIIKIFDLMGLTNDERLKFFQFFGVEESEYEEEEIEEEKVNDIPLGKSKNRIKMDMINITKSNEPNTYYQVEKRTKTTSSSGYPEIVSEKISKVVRNNVKEPNAYYQVEKRTKTTSSTEYPEIVSEKISKVVKNNVITEPNAYYQVEKRTKTTSSSGYPEIVNEKISKVVKNNVIEKGNKSIKIEVYKEQIIQSENQSMNVKTIEEEKNTQINKVDKIETVKKQKPIRKKTDIIKYIGGSNDTAEKLPPTSLESLIGTMNHIPSILRNIKKNKLKGKKTEIIKEPERKKGGATKIIEIKKEIVTEVNNYEKEDELSDYDTAERNKTVEITKTIEEKNQYEMTPLPPKSKKVKYSFVLPKSFEYENNIMYLTGSIPVLGNWKQNEAIQMDEEIKNNQLFYTKNIEIDKEDFPFEYKYFYIKNGKTIWLGKPKVNYKSYPEYINLYEKITEQRDILSIFDLNIRYLNEVDGLNIWDNRKDKLLKTILKHLPDVLFFQEITRSQYDYMEDHLNSVYDNVGIYRDNTDHSEKCSISYNKIKYTMTDWGQFWLSSTPYTQGSNDFGNFFPRICTWVLLRQIDGEQFLCFNIHLDHVNFDAHLPCINVVINESEKILKNFPDTRMVFLGGCFYCEEDDVLVDKIKQLGYQEVMFENTFHDFTGEADRHWDYMFWREINYDENTTIRYKNSFVLKEDSIVSLSNQQFISDHYPVIAEFEIRKKNVKYNAEYNKEDNINIENNGYYNDEKDRNEFKRSAVFEEYEENEPENNNTNNYQKITEQKIYKYSSNNDKGDDDDEEEEEVVEIEEEIEVNDNKEDNKNKNRKKKEKENDEEEEEDDEKDDYKEENEYNQKNSDEKKGKKTEKEEIKIEKKVVINETKNDNDNNDNNNNENEEEEEVEVEQEEEEQPDKKEEEEHEESEDQEGEENEEEEE